MRKSLHALAGALPAVGIVAFLGAQGQGSDLKLRDRLLAEAPAAWSKIVALCGQLEVKIVDRRFSGESETANLEWHNKVSGSNCLITRISGAQGAQEVICRNPTGAFRLGKAGPSRAWRVQHVGKQPDIDLETFGVRNFSLPQLHVASNYLPEMFGSPLFIIKSVQPIDRGAGKFARVEFEYDDPASAVKGFLLRGGMITLNPARMWAVEEYDVQVQFKKGRPQRWVQRNEFERQPADSPFVLRREQTREIPGKPKDRWIWEIEHLSRGPIPARDFTLAAFGLPEIGDVSSSGQVRLWMILVAAGIASIVIAIWVRRRAYAS